MGWKKPLRILINSEIILPTGYGSAMTEILDRLYLLGRDQGNPKYEIFVQAVGLRVDPYQPFQNPRPYQIIPMTGNVQQHPVGQDQLQNIVHQIRPDIILGFNDIWFTRHLIDPNVITSEMRRRMKVLQYLPIDLEPIPPSWIPEMKQFDHTIFYSKFAIEQVIARDSDMQGRCSMIYHGVNPKIFKPLPKAYMNIWKKQTIMPGGVSLENKFIVGMVARNQARKSHPQMLQGFAKFAEGKNDVVLLLHCVAMDQGWDLNDLINRWGLTGKCFITHPGNNPAHGIPRENMVVLYNAMDVHCNICEGEGFGIPIIESLSCGTPNLVTNYAAGAELVRDSGGGLLIEREGTIYRGADHNAARPLNSVQDIADKLQWMYAHPVEREEMGKKARAFGLEMNWDSKVMQFDRLFTALVEERNLPLQGVEVY